MELLSIIVFRASIRRSVKQMKADKTFSMEQVFGKKA